MWTVGRKKGGLHNGEKGIRLNGGMLGARKFRRQKVALVKESPRSEDSIARGRWGCNESLRHRRRSRLKEPCGLIPWGGEEYAPCEMITQSTDRTTDQGFHVTFAGL